MTAQELLKAEIGEADYQLKKVFEGLSEADVDAKPLPTMMSIREMVEHLMECCVATTASVAGKEHPWGSYSAPDKAWDAMTTEFWRLRAAATDKVLTSEDPKAITSGAAFLVAHDNYHVGQMAAIRIALDSAWDPYSIYNF